jgi:hypothetical protein
MFLGSSLSSALAGQGMLTSMLQNLYSISTARIFSLGAVCGNVFASPNAQQVMRGIDLIDNDKG